MKQDIYQVVREMGIIFPYRPSLKLYGMQGDIKDTINYLSSEGILFSHVSYNPPANLTFANISVTFTSPRHLQTFLEATRRYNLISDELNRIKEKTGLILEEMLKKDLEDEEEAKRNAPIWDL